MLLTDFYALIGIDLAACAVFLRATRVFTPKPVHPKASGWVMWIFAICLVGLWLPLGGAGLSLLAFARGISSDLSVTSVALAGLYIAQRMGAPPVQDREKKVVYTALALTAVLLYPTALGLGDWDAYRLGWEGIGLVVGLSLLILLCFLKGLRLLPLLVAAALIAWSFGLLESGNLWDYLIDPWIACVSIGVEIRRKISSYLRPIM